MATPKRLAVIGAGWAGLSAALQLCDAGHQAVVFEASAQLGGRARRLSVRLPSGEATSLDNGQHILIGAYQRTLALMQRLGIDRQQAFHQTPLRLVFPNGDGLRLPNWPRPWDALAGIALTRGWSWSDKGHLLRRLLRWQRQRFACPASTTVAQLCQGLPQRLIKELFEPLCVSALNTAPEHASAQVFLRVLQDSVMGPSGSAHLLLPTSDLSTLLPEPAARRLLTQGAELRLGERATSLQPATRSWCVNGQVFDGVVLACAPSHAAGLLQTMVPRLHADQHAALTPWLMLTQALHYEAIATVYAWSEQARLPEPMLALHSRVGSAPAQFVFDRGQLTGQHGVLAFVVSASQGSRQTLQAQVLEQARVQLGLHLHALATVVEKRATFACTPGLKRPGPQVLPGLVACGDYIDGPYPATLEGAVRSAEAAAACMIAQLG